MATITLSTAAREVLTRNRTRKSLSIQNEDTAIAIFVKRERTATPTVSSTDHDFRIGPGGSLTLNAFLDGTEAIQDRYTAIAASGTPLIAVFETEDQVR